MKRGRTARDKYPLQYAIAVNKRRKIAGREPNVAAQRAVARNAGFVRKSGVYGLRGPTGIEKKYLDLNVINPSIPTTGVIIPSLNLVDVGTGSNQRIGNKVSVKNINIRFWFTTDGNATGYQPTYNLRYIVYLDKQCNGQAALVNEILSTNGTASFRNMDTVDRFVILADKYVNCMTQAYGSTTAGVTFSTDGCQFRKFAWKGNVGINWSGAGDTINLIRSNNFGIALIGNPVGANCTIAARIKYTDD